MQIFSLFMFLGIFTSFLIPETKRLTLEQLSGEEDTPGVVHEPVIPQEKGSPNGTEAGEEATKVPTETHTTAI
jgi:PHS family inorganic phosphate transporter-like MFS transporter